MAKQKKPRKSIITLLRGHEIIAAIGLGALRLRGKSVVGGADYETFFMYERDKDGKHTDMPSQVRVEITPRSDGKIISTRKQS